MRELLPGRLRARPERFGVDRNPATVLDPEVVAEVTALLETVSDPAADLELVQVAGGLPWARYRVLDPGESQQDLAAVALFPLVYRARSGAVADQVRTPSTSTNAA